MLRTSPASWKNLTTAMIPTTNSTSEKPAYNAPMKSPPLTSSEVDVPAGTDLDQLIKNLQLRLIETRLDAVVDGAVTSVDQLRHRRNTVVILAGEQNPVGRHKIEAERK
jgi:hypothetical protein